MPTIELDSPPVMYAKVARVPAVGRATKKVAEKGENRAARNLAQARASTPHAKIFGPKHATGTDWGSGGVDAWFSLTGTNPMAIEFGHYPSGYFAPSKYGRITKAPHGLYILTSAAFGLGSVNITPAGRR